MPRAARAPARDPASARVDGRRVLFAVRQDGIDVRCAISLNALQDISERRYVKPAEVLQCFAQAQLRIEAAARHKLTIRSLPEGGLLNLWSDDFEEPRQA
jgi:hypothetical protein